jgi:hypothetical protein
MVEEALQRVYHGASNGKNRNFGLPGFWKYVGKGSLAETQAMNKTFITIAHLEVALRDPRSTLLVGPWH